MDMPSYRAHHELEHAERADECYVLLSDATADSIAALRRVLAADADTLAEMARANHDAVYDCLRNLQLYAQALDRLTDERVTETADRIGRLRTDDGADAKTNGDAAPIPEAAMAA